jgi:hypothetical protein
VRTVLRGRCRRSDRGGGGRRCGGLAHLGREAVSPAGQGAEETDALLAATVLPLFAGVALFSALMALDIGMVT